MTIAPTARFSRAPVSSVVSSDPDSHPAFLPFPALALGIALAIGLLGLGLALSTRFEFGELPPLPLAFVMVGGLVAGCRLAPPSRTTRAVEAIALGTGFLVTAAFCAVIACYGGQRLGMPLRDEALRAADHALGFDWLGFVQWVDARPLVAGTLFLAYASIAIQSPLPVMIFAWTGDLPRVRAYLFAYAAMLAVVAIGGAMFPAAGAAELIQNLHFRNVAFGGATPLDDLALLRSSGPIYFAEQPGAITSFPSFHAAMAIMVTLSLRRIRPLFYGLVVLNLLMLAGSLTEGCHYLTDLIVGGALAGSLLLLGERLYVKPQAPAPEARS